MEDGYEGSGSFDGTSRWMNVNIDGNFELNATFNSNVSLDAVSIPYFYSGFKPGDGQSSFSVTGDVKISVVTIASDAGKNLSTQAFTFTAEPSSSEEAKKTVNVGNPNSTFSLFTAYFKDPDNYDKADTMAGANGVYARLPTMLTLSVRNKADVSTLALLRCFKLLA